MLVLAIYGEVTNPRPCRLRSSMPTPMTPEQLAKYNDPKNVAARAEYRKRAKQARKDREQAELDAKRPTEEQMMARAEQKARAYFKALKRGIIID